MDSSYSTGEAALRTGRFRNPVEDASRWQNPDHGRPCMTSEANGVPTMTPQLHSSRLVVLRADMLEQKSRRAMVLN